MAKCAESGLITQMDSEEEAPKAVIELIKEYASETRQTGLETPDCFNGGSSVGEWTAKPAWRI